MARRFFLLFFFSHSVTVQSVIYQLKGQQVQLDPGITRQPEQIMCRHNGKIIVEFNGFEEQVFGSYKGRVTLNWHSAQLQISDLRLEDSGTYDYEIYIGGKLFRQSYELEVIEKVAKPNITCLMNSDSSSTVSAVLLCSVELNQPQSSLKFGWSSRGNVQHGQQLTIFLGGELDEEEYTCRVSNLASSETATFRAKDCHTDAGLSAGMIALIVLISILTVIFFLGLLILFWRRIGYVTTALKNISAKCHSEKAPTRTGPKKSRGEQKGPAVSPSSLHDNTSSCLDKNQSAVNNKLDGEELKTEETNVAHSSTEAAPADLDAEGEETDQDEGQMPLLGDPPTASPRPQKQLDTENGLDQKSFQIERKRPELGGQSTPSSPLQGDLDTTQDPEREEREADSHAESDFSNSPNMAPQDTDGEHNNDANADYKSDSSCQGKQDQSDNSPIQDIQQSTNPGPTGSEATQDEKDPNLSCVSD